MILAQSTANQYVYLVLLDAATGTPYVPEDEINTENLRIMICKANGTDHEADDGEAEALFGPLLRIRLSDQDTDITGPSLMIAILTNGEPEPYDEVLAFAFERFYVVASEGIWNDFVALMDEYQYPPSELRETVVRLLQLGATIVRGEILAPPHTPLVTDDQGRVTVGANEDKTEYELVEGYDPAKSAAQQAYLEEVGATLEATASVVEKLNTLLEQHNSVWRFTAGALANTPDQSILDAIAQAVHDLPGDTKDALAVGDLSFEQTLLLLLAESVGRAELVSANPWQIAYYAPGAIEPAFTLNFGTDFTHRHFAWAFPPSPPPPGS